MLLRALLFLLFSRFDTLARSGLSSPSVRGTSFSGGEGITLLPAISCRFCPPHGSCIEQSRIEPGSSPPPAVNPPIGRSLRTPDPPRMKIKRPTRFVSRDLEYSLFLASEATVPGVGGGVGRAPVVTNPREETRRAEPSDTR